MTKPIDFDLLETVIREQLGESDMRERDRVSPVMENMNRVNHLSLKPA